MDALTLDAISLPQDIPLSLPSRLVDQRPDIRAASAQLHAASAQVGIATAAMLPQITLSGSAGSQALRAGDVFSAGTGAWSLGLNLTQPLFHGGELLHQKRAAQAGLDKAVADWQQTVLTAFQNVADSLEALQYDAQTLAAQAEAERSAARQLELVRQQYKFGATGYLNLLDAERSYQQALIALIQARAARLSDTTALYTALGGSWREGDGATAAANPSTASN
jgi:NodT family efflux transporter outer membrane factor (OMF) lipoprotein